MGATLAHVLQIAAGGALGSVARYGLTGLVHRVVGATFPAGTFVVNVLGCFLFGLIAGIGTERVLLATSTRSFVLIGLLGGFTTFSTFGYETVMLLREGAWGPAALNALGQLILGLLALSLGLAAARWL